MATSKALVSVGSSAAALASDLLRAIDSGK
jgi:hypothetical protein